MLLTQNISLPGLYPVKKAAQAADDFIFIKQGTAYHKVVIRDIRYLESDNVYIYVHTQEKRYLVRSTISQYLEILNSPSFYRVQRSFAVNILHVTSIDMNHVNLDKTSIPIGKTYRNELLGSLKLG